MATSSSSYIYTLHQDVLDVELCTYALTLVNKTLYEIDDQPTFYDQTDYMEDLGIDRLEDSKKVSRSKNTKMTTTQGDQAD